MRQTIVLYPNGGPKGPAESDAFGKTCPVGATRELFMFYAKCGWGSDDIVLRLNYWSSERKARNGRWVKEDTWDHQDRHRNRARQRPAVPLHLGIAAIRAVSGRIRLEKPEEWQ